MNVITPLARFDNLKELTKNLKPHNVKWHIITDDDNDTPIEITEPWIHHYVCPNESVEFWARSNNSINWFIRTQDLHDEEYYCVLNDDDSYEDNFFLKLQEQIKEANESKKPCELVITSMKRGHNIPQDVPPVKRHPTYTLYAVPENMQVCGVGVEQFFIKGKLLRKHQLPLTPYGDGELIVELVSTYTPLYLPSLYVYFNYLEPGRWIKNMSMKSFLLGK